MPYKINIDLQHLDDGAEIPIDGLGTFVKGGDNYVSDEAAEAFEVLNISNEPAYSYEYDEEGNIKTDSQGNKLGQLVGMQQVRRTLPEIIRKYQGFSAEVVLEVPQEAPTETEQQTLSEGESAAVGGNTTPEVNDFQKKENEQPEDLGTPASPADIDKVADDSGDNSSDEMTLYRHLTDDPIEPAAWPDSGQHNENGDKLYTFFMDTEPGHAHGVSDEWAIDKAAK